MGYEEKATQKQRLLNVLKTGAKVTQIDLKRYFELMKGNRRYRSDVVDALAELGIANLPARIFGLKKDGYEIITEDIKVNGRYGKTHYSVYRLNEPKN